MADILEAGMLAKLKLFHFYSEVIELSIMGEVLAPFHFSNSLRKSTAFKQRAQTQAVVD
jgi:hypothetical protein